jgi:cytochrome P450
VLFMLAGHDTTSTTLSYALWALGHHPDIKEQVYAEVAALGNRPLNPGDVPSLECTVRVLHEALRLCPPAAGVPRLVTRDLVVDGYRLVAGTVALVSFWTMHRDPKLWDDPLTFDPDRFLPERTQGRSRWQYRPFGGGPRSCVGDHFAMLEATLALATIVRSVEIHSMDDDFPLETPFTVVAAAPIRARVHTRTQAPSTKP